LELAEEIVKNTMSRFALNCILIVFGVYLRQKEYAEVFVEQGNLKKQ
jgi:hypothetical protein